MENKILLSKSFSTELCNKSFKAHYVFSFSNNLTLMYNDFLVGKKRVKIIGIINKYHIYTCGNGPNQHGGKFNHGRMTKFLALWCPCGTKGGCMELK